MTDLEKKETQAIDLIRAASKSRRYIVSYSGGKDSDVMLHLFRKAKVDFDLIYKNTTIDPPHTLQHVRQAGAFVIEPRYSFFRLIERKGFPSFARRFCCSELKEGYIGKYVALGVRREESKKRAERYDAPEVCRIYTKTKVTCQLLPLVFWTNEDILSYIKAESITLHPLYYNSRGVVDVRRRLGCLGCPLPYNRSLPDFLQYPRLVRAWIRHNDIFRQTHPASEAVAEFHSSYDQFANNVFYHDTENFRTATYGLFPIDWRSKLSDIFGIDL